LKRFIEKGEVCPFTIPVIKRRPMSKYNLEINYLLLGIDISPEELAEINAEADGIIAKNTENPEKTAEGVPEKEPVFTEDGTI
jgi:hypothetical protein